MTVNTGCVTDATMAIFRLMKSVGIELNNDELGEVIIILRRVFDTAHNQGRVAERRTTMKL